MNVSIFKVLANSAGPIQKPQKHCLLTGVPVSKQCFCGFCIGSTLFAYIPQKGFLVSKELV